MRCLPSLSLHWFQLDVERLQFPKNLEEVLAGVGTSTFNTHIKSSIIHPSCMITVELHVEMPQQLRYDEAGFRECYPGSCR